MSIAHADDKKTYGEISAGRYTKKVRNMNVHIGNIQQKHSHNTTCTEKKKNTPTCTHREDRTIGIKISH